MTPDNLDRELNNIDPELTEHELALVSGGAPTKQASAKVFELNDYSFGVSMPITTS